MYPDIIKYSRQTSRDKYIKPYILLKLIDTRFTWDIFSANRCLYTVAMATRKTNNKKSKIEILSSSENYTIFWKCERVVFVLMSWVI